MICGRYQCRQKHLLPHVFVFQFLCSPRYNTKNIFTIQTLDKIIQTLLERPTKDPFSICASILSNPGSLDCLISLSSVTNIFGNIRSHSVFKAGLTSCL